MYNAIKTDLATLLGITKDALHIHVGLVVFVGLIVVFRRSLLVPWLGVLAFEGINELMDIFHWHQGAFSFEIGDAFKDLFSTMLWPTVAVLALRFRETGVRKPKELSAVSSQDTPVK
jgi:hypothetical protein